MSRYSHHVELFDASQAIIFVTIMKRRKKKVTDSVKCNHELKINIHNEREKQTNIHKNFKYIVLFA